MGKSTGTTIEVWKGRAHWHWHFRRGGRVVADAENFPSKGNAIRAAKATVAGVLAEWAPGAECTFATLPDQVDGVTRIRAEQDACRRASFTLGLSKVETLNRRMGELTGAPLPGAQPYK